MRRLTEQQIKEKINFIDAQIIEQKRIVAQTQQQLDFLRAEKLCFETGIYKGDVVELHNGTKLLIRSMDSYKFMASKQNKDGSWNKKEQHVFVSDVKKTNNE